MNSIAICLSSDNNYVQHLGATISSVLKNKNSDEFIKIFVIDGGISDENKIKLSNFENEYDCKINYVLPDMEKLSNCNTFKGDYISLVTYYRLLIPEIIPNETRVIYLDCDIIVRHSLGNLYKKDFGDSLILGVRDVSEEVHSKRLGLKRYINAGVLLINSKRMREQNSVEKMFNWIITNQDKIECHDQDVINASLSGEIGYVEDMYNVQVMRDKEGTFDEIEDPVILHFISPKKPWTVWKPLNSTRWSKEYFKALENTPWEGFIRKYKKQSMWYYPLRVFYPTGSVKTAVRSIFSIRNSDDKSQKIITLLGIKFKTKRTKEINAKH